MIMSTQHPEDSNMADPDLHLTPDSLDLAFINPPSDGKNGRNGSTRSQVPLPPTEQDSPQPPRLQPPSPQLENKSPQKSRLRWSAWSLRTKTTLLAIALGTLPVLIIGGAGYFLASRTLTQSAADTKKEQSVEIMDKITRFVFERYGDVQTLANFPIFRNAKQRATVSSAEKEQILTRFADTYQVYDSIAVYGVDGNLLVSGGKEAAPANISDREYFQTALKTGKPYVSQPVISKVTKLPSIFFSAPIKDAATDQIIAVVRTRMPVPDLEKVVASFGNLDSEIFYHVFDASGTIFMATEKEQVGHEANQDFPEGLAERRLTGQPDAWVAYDQNKKDKSILIGFATTAPFQGMPDLKWGVAYTTNTQEAFKAANDLLLSLAIGTGAISIISGLLAAYLANRATRPLAVAARTVEKIGQGDLSARIIVEGEDELAILGTNINQMAEDIETLVENQKAETGRIEQARQEARQEADAATQQQRQEKEFLQKRALELLIEVDPVSRGDLTVRANVTADEIGTVADSYNAIIRSLRQIVQQVQGATQSVTQTAQDNEVAVKQMATESIQQSVVIANALQQIQRLTETSQGVADRAKQATAQVQLATQAVQAGDLAMNRTVSGISTIRETVSETAKKVKRLGEASQKISKVVNLISGFAAQTNLLALNAAIEAARAGEEGRGFSVVAEEVRALAQQSAAATAEIEQLVEEIQSQTSAVVIAMEAGTEQVVAGTDLVEESRQKLGQISDVSTQVNQLIQEIAQAAADQTQTSTTVSQTMQDVAAIATTTSHQSEDVAQSFTHLLEVAQGLKVSVAQFKI